MDRSESENNHDGENWWVLPLGDVIQASPILQTVLEAFAAAQQQAGATADVSLWLRTESDGLHCQKTLYFSVGCEAVERQFDAVFCSKPNQFGLTCIANALPLSR